MPHFKDPELESQMTEALVGRTIVAVGPAVNKDGEHVGLMFVLDDGSHLAFTIELIEGSPHIMMMLLERESN